VVAAGLRGVLVEGVSMIVLVPTYRRPELFARLCADLARELRPYDCVIVHDDASPEPYAGAALAASRMEARSTVITATENRGKKRYWETVGKLLDGAKNVAAGRHGFEVAYLADDLRLAEGWRDKVLAWLDVAETYEGCIGLHAHRDGRATEWGLPGGEDVGTGERMAWQDGVWVTRVRWLDALRPEMVRRDWNNNPHLGSGAWRSSSYRTHEAGLWWLRPKARLCWHADENVSVMNPHHTASESRRKTRRVYTEGE
jgi:hypothetical protein